MSAQILDAIDGIITTEVTGIITPDELAATQAQILAHLQEWGGGAILNICEEFQGFADGDWSGLNFQDQADHLIRKMAIIGEAQWEEMATTFTGKGYRPFPIEFFPTGHMREAHAWLKA